MIPFPAIMSAYLRIKSRGLLSSLSTRVREINKFGEYYHKAPDETLRQYFEEIRTDLALSKPEIIEVQLFALLRELARRTVGMFPYDVQILAALVLRRKKIIQMNTGEGKTLVAPFHAIMEALYGHQVVIVSPNDYLSYRDAKWMGPLYEAVGVSYSTVQPWYGDEEKYKAYKANVIYVSSTQLVFDYLRKHHSVSYFSDFPIPLETVIIDEIDSVLLDQGIRPYALVSPVNFQSEQFREMERLVGSFEKDVDFKATSENKEIQFTNSGLDKLARIAALNPLPFSELLFYLKCALSAHHHYERDKDYILEGRGIVLIDSFTGRPAYGSSFPFGTHQAIEQKEGVPLSYPNTTINQITMQGFFSRFKTLSGMSGSAVYNALEFRILYKLDVVPIAPNKPPIRQDSPDVIYRTKPEQYTNVMEVTRDIVKARRPVLIGTTTIDDAQSIAALCTTESFEYRLLTARNHFEEAQIIEEAGWAGRVTIAALMAGRGVDIKLDQQALQAGGLHIIGVGRNENRRLDEQLQGRAGRQGDPGSSVFILSLEDDLLKMFAGDRVKEWMKTIGMDKDVAIKSTMLSRRIKAIQKKLVFLRLYQRQSALIFEQELTKARDIVFNKREILSRLTAYDHEIERLITRFTDRVSALKNTELSDKLHEISHRLKIHLSPRMRHLSESNTAVFADDLKRFLREVYQQRRQEAQQYGLARERLIFLRSIDYCWSLFIDESKKIFESLAFAGTLRSKVQLLNEIGKRVLGENEKLLKEIDEISLFYLMHIHDEPTLREIKYWRGMGERHDGSGSAYYEDGISPPEAYLTIYRTEDDQAPTNPIILPRLLSATKETTKFSKHVNDYITELSTQKNSPRNFQRIKAVLEQFQLFQKTDDISPELALNALPQYLEWLKDQGIGYIGRRKQRRIILGLFGYLQRKKLLPDHIPTTIKQNIRTRAANLLKPLTNPFLILNLILVVGGFIAYRYISILPIPFLVLDNQSNPLLQSSLPPFFIRLLDQLLLSGALTAVGIGILGIIPFLIMRLLAKAMNREWHFESPIIYLPVATAGSLLVLLLLVTSGINWQTLTKWEILAIFGSILAGTLSITFFVWIAQYTEFLDGVQLVILGNALVVLFGEWMAQVIPHAASISPLYFTLPAFVLILFWLYYNKSRIQLDIVSIGRFDFRAGEIKSSPNKIYLDTVFDGYHYLFAFIIVLFLEFWSYPLIRIIPRRVMDVFSSTQKWHWQLFVYIFFVCWFIYRKAKYRLAPETIRGFLQERDSFLQDAQDWQQANSRLSSKLYKTIAMNWLFEIAIIGSLIIFISTTFTGTYQIGFEYVLYITTVTALGLYLLLSVGRQTAAALFQSGTSAVMSIPLPVEKQDDSSWPKRMFDSFRSQSGLVGLLIIIAGLISFFEYAYRFIKWLLRMIF